PIVGAPAPEGGVRLTRRACPAGSARAGKRRRRGPPPRRGGGPWPARRPGAPPDATSERPPPLPLPGLLLGRPRRALLSLRTGRPLGARRAALRARGGERVCLPERGHHALRQVLRHLALNALQHAAIHQGAKQEREG